MINWKTIGAQISAAATAVAFAASAAAAPTGTTDPNDFGPTATLIDFTAIPLADVGMEITTQLQAGFGVTVSGGLFVLENPDAPGTTFAVNADPSVMPTSPNNPISFIFDSIRSGFGIAGVFLDDVVITLLRDGMVTATTGVLDLPPQPSASPGDALFLGFLDPDGFDTVEISAPNGLELFGLFGTIDEVPAPNALLLLGFGLAGAAAMRRRRKI